MFPLKPTNESSSSASLQQLRTDVDDDHDELAKFEPQRKRRKIQEEKEYGNEIHHDYEGERTIFQAVGKEEEVVEIKKDDGDRERQEEKLEETERKISRGTGDEKIGASSTRRTTL
jgi:hypothetical protein